IEAQCALGTVRRLGQPLKARVAIDEAADQPGAGHAIDPQAAPRCPSAALVLAEIETRDEASRLMRLIGRQQALDSLAEVHPRGFALLARFAGEVVDRSKRLVVALQLALQAKGLGRLERPQGAVRFLPGLA